MTFSGRDVARNIEDVMAGSTLSHAYARPMEIHK